MDDSDVKIFKKEKRDDKFDEIGLISKMNEERGNGNIDKSKRLGSYLASIFLDKDVLLQKLRPIIGDKEYTKAESFQIKILMFFAAEYQLNSLLPNNILRNTAINALYDDIHDKAEEFYKEFSDGAEYSFYYLAVRKNDDISQNIGKCFSMLCGKGKENEEYASLGSELWSGVLEEVEEIIRRYEFVGMKNKFNIAFGDCKSLCFCSPILCCGH